MCRKVLSFSACVQTSGKAVVTGKALSGHGGLFSNSIRIHLGKREKGLVGERKNVRLDRKMEMN